MIAALPQQMRNHCRFAAASQKCGKTTSIYVSNSRGYKNKPSDELTTSDYLNGIGLKPNV